MNINPQLVNLELENMEEKSVCSASTPEDAAISTIHNISSSHPHRSGKHIRFDEFSPEFNQTILSDVCKEREYDQLAQFAATNQPAQLNPYTMQATTLIAKLPVWVTCHTYHEAPLYTYLPTYLLYIYLSI